MTGMKWFERFLLAAVCALFAGVPATQASGQTIAAAPAPRVGVEIQGNRTERIGFPKRWNAREWFQKGKDFFEAKNYAAARNAFGNSIEINEGHRILFQRALAMHMRFRHYEMANDYIEKTAEIDSNLAEAHFFRGLACEALGKDQESDSHYRRAIELDPDNGTLYLARAGLYQRRGDYRRAVDSCNGAIRKNPRDGRAYIERGKSYIGLEFFPLAVRDGEKAIELGVRSGEAFYARGFAYLRSGDYRKAIDDLDRSIELQPASAEAYLNRGLSYEKIGLPEKALADFQAAAGLGSQEAQGVLRARGIQN